MMAEQKKMIIEMIEQINNSIWISMIFAFVSGFYEVQGGAK